MNSITIERLFRHRKKIEKNPQRRQLEVMFIEIKFYISIHPPIREIQSILQFNIAITENSR